LEGDQEERLENEEIALHLKKLKKKERKELHCGRSLDLHDQIREKLKELLKRIWKGKGFPEEWRKKAITPIHKKGDTSDVKNYRKITLLCTAYKIYAAILTETLRGEIERKGSLAEIQAGFRN